MSNVIIESSDKMNFTVEEKIAKMSATIKAMMDNFGSNLNGQNQGKISLPTVRGEILERVIDWCVHHQGDMPAVDAIGPDVNQVEHIDQWDNEFFQMEHDIFMELTIASSSLEVDGLMTAVCKRILKMMEGKTAEEIRQMFNVKNDFTPAEEDTIRRENEFWLSAITRRT